MSVNASRIRVRIVVTGKVQGVFFRASARDEANRLNIGGFAMNRPDGSVLIEAEGEPGAVEQFRNWCSRGPSRARVDDLNVTPIPPRDERTFVTR